MWPTRRLRLAFALAAALGCAEAWRPATFVEGPRVLAVRAEPPDVSPGAATLLTALVVDPSVPARPTTLIWFACDPDPEKLDQTACAKFATLGDPAQLAGSAEVPEGVRPLGLGCAGPGCPAGWPTGEAAYLAPAGTFDKVGPDDPRRRKGVLAMVVLLAVGEAPGPDFPPTEEQLRALLARVEARQVPSVVSIKRVRITEDPSPNANPEIDGVRFDGGLWTADQRFKLSPGQSHRLDGVARDGSAEHYLQQGPDGALEEKQERLVVSWFSTLGRFEAARSEAGSEIQRFVVPTPFDEIPGDRRATLWLVLRDGRGGVGWLTRRLFVCDPFLEAGVIDAIEPAQGPPGTEVLVRGRGLEDALDVRVGPGFLSAGRFDAARGGWVGSIPEALSPGMVRVAARGRSCRPDPETGFAVTP